MSRPELEWTIAGANAASCRAGNLYTGKAVVVSGKAAAMIGSMASSVGDRVGKTLGIQNKPDGKPPKGVKGLINRSLVAFNSVTDSLETGYVCFSVGLPRRAGNNADGSSVCSGKHLLASGSKSTTQVVNHSYGAEAAAAAAKVGGSVQHVALVYIE